jgi:beta-glucanase (GH16 family)
MPRDSASLLRVKSGIVSLTITLLCIFWILGASVPSAYSFTNLVWSDEFNGSSSNVNTANWNFDLSNSSSIAGSGWGNQEKEYYTSRTNNAYVANGLLHMVTIDDQFGGAGTPYSSARLQTLGKFSMTFGRVDFRAKLPGNGLYWWPAMWMLATNYSNGSNGVSNEWPRCGEIDVCESMGSTPGDVLGTIHHDSSGSPGNDSPQGGQYNFPSGTDTTNGFHTYSVLWYTNKISFAVDGSNVYETASGWTSSTGPFPAPFNHPFYIIMNLAVGGTFFSANPSVATINANDTFPAEMDVDFVRAYQDLPTQAPLLGVLSVSPTNACSNGGTVITISGTNFVGGATVTVGGVSAGFVTYIDTNTLSVVAPSLSAGAKSISVINPDGTTSTLANAVNYLNGPASFAGLTNATPALVGATLTWPAAQGVSPFTYHVYEASSSGGENFSSPTLTTTNLSTFVSLSSGPTCTNIYYFVVRAVDACGNSDGNTVELSVQPIPSSFTFAGLANATGIVGGASLTWAAASQGALPPVTYYIYESTSSNVGSLTNLVGQTTSLSATVGSLDPGGNCTNIYYFLVHAVDNCNRVDTNQVVLSAQPLGAPPTFAGVGTITAAINAATVTWSAASGGTLPTTYNVFEATTSGAENFASPLLSTTALSAFVSLYPGSNNPITYYFVVRAQTACNISESNTVEQSIQPLLDPNASQVGDGIPNGWKEQYGLNPFDPNLANEDPDGDGMNNLQEYLTGTDPTNSASYFHVTSVTPQGYDMLITWTCGGGLTNVVQSTTDPTMGYSDISPDIILLGTGDTVTNYVDPGAATNNPANFYRIRLGP